MTGLSQSDILQKIDSARLNVSICVCKDELVKGGGGVSPISPDKVRGAISLTCVSHIHSQLLEIFIRL